MLDPRFLPQRNLPSPVRILFWEAAFAFVYDTWMGPLYLSGFAGELGVSITLVSFLTALPFIGTLGQLFGAYALERQSSVKRYTIVLAILSRGLWTLPLVLAAIFWAYSSRSGQPFPTNLWFALTAVNTCFVSLLGSAAGVGWMSWMKGLIPNGFRGRFFGLRQRFVMGGLILANLSASFFVGWKPSGYPAGYVLIAVLALVSAAISTRFLGKVPDIVATHRHEGPRRAPLAAYREALANREFRNILIANAAFNATILLAGPYIPYYFTKELSIPMSSVALWAVLTNVGAFFAASFWGKRIDGSGNPRRTLLLTGHIMALSPLLYLVPSQSWVRTVAPFEFLVNGMAWSGYMLAMTTMMFAICPKRRNAAYFALFAAAGGLAGAAATLAGGQIAQMLSQWGGFRALWMIAAVARLGVLWTVFRLLKPGRIA